MPRLRFCPVIPPRTAVACVDKPEEHQKGARMADELLPQLCSNVELPAERRRSHGNPSSTGAMVEQRTMSLKYAKIRREL